MLLIINYEVLIMKNETINFPKMMKKI